MQPSRSAPTSSTELDAFLFSRMIGRYGSAIGNTGRRALDGARKGNKSTALSMGIRSLLGFGKKPKKDEEEEQKKSENPDDIKRALEAIKADLEAVDKESPKQNTADKTKGAATAKKNVNNPPGSATKLNKKVAPQKIDIPLPEISTPRMKNRRTKTPLPRPVERSSASTYGETVQDRIKRVKSGQMTDEEKAAFLTNALTRTPPGNKGPRIRQEIPSPSGDLKIKKKSSSSSSSFPKDSLWDAVMGKGQGSGGSSEGNPARYPEIRFSATGERLDDSAKREYLDMVTNPDRFASYAAMGGYTNKSPATDGDSLPKGTDEEKQDAVNRRKREEEEMIRNAELEKAQRKRVEEVQTKQVQTLEAKRRDEEKSLRKEKESREAEIQRQENLQAQQDDYWAKKLEEENARRERSMTPKEKEQREFERKQDAVARLEKAAVNKAKMAEIEMIREEERVREDPHESKILQEAADDDLHEREKNANIMEEASARVSNTVQIPRPQDVSANSFVEQEEEKKRKLDQFRKEQNARLASLNSPLPKTPPPKVEMKRPNSVPGTVGGVRPVLGNVKPAAGGGKPTAGGLNPILGNVRPAAGGSKSTAARPPPPSPSAPAPNLNLADLTMRRSASASQPKKTPPPRPAPASAPAPRLSLAEMTMLKRPQGSGTAPATKTSFPPPVPPRSSPPAPPSSGPQGPIRQSVPGLTNLDDEEEDFFEYSRDGGNSGMSLKEIMAKESASSGSAAKTDNKPSAAKQQSKMWGIDIDKFMD
eukprot:CAMPEP_0197246370 /NCGR_PEP_ID=MMETSP1429-20130617/10832_1 /TAXON_ID=49237 /ORGANISM="Chaetoceros  sp., Strain UNC1202" /LENGTH=762 /DNA_ID=CAMNT_0042707005 /DNA_START=78 /DNA_END=2366 /DNA_ORIENTATION=+